MNCDVCNSTEFWFNDGAYLCRECNSQIKETQDEQDKEEGFSNRSLVKSPVTKKKSKVKDIRNLYSPWTTTEGYNVILYKQVSALINLGASEKLKNVVLYMWSQYLQKCEIAFRIDYNAEEQVPRLSAFPKERDVKFLYGDKYAKRKSKRSKKKQVKKKTSDIKVDIKYEDTDDSVEFDSDAVADISSASDTESLSMSSDSSASKKHINLNLSSHAKKFQRTFGKGKLGKQNPGLKENCVHNMTISKTLCFCYLGLLFTEDQLLLCDFLRLVSEGKIPYINVTEVFPPSMKLQCSDRSNFTTLSIPDAKKMVVMCARLLDFLKLPNFNHRSLMEIVFRFVKDLNLPDNIIPIVKLLNDKMKRPESYELVKRMFKKHSNKSNAHVLSMPVYEIQAMASIIVALKLLFVLDGKYELEHSEIMLKVNVLLEGQKLFVWDEWKQQISLKEYLFMKSGKSYSHFSRLDSLSADQIIKKYPYTRLQKSGYNATKTEKRKRFAYAESRKEIKTILEDIVGLNDADGDYHTPSSFLLKYQQTILTSEWKSLPMFKETEQIDFSFLNKDFSSHLLFYKHNDEISAESEELIYFLLTSLYESAEIMTLCNSASSCQNILRTSAKYWFKNFTCKDLNDSNLIWLEKLPFSFRWLLIFLSKYIQVPCVELFTEVVNIEKELFLHTKKAKCN